MMQNVISQQLDLPVVEMEWVTSVNLILQEVKIPRNINQANDLKPTRSLTKEFEFN